MRTIRESLRYTEQCTKLGVTVRRLDEATASICWAASIDPTVFPVVPGTDMRQAVVRAFPEVPRLRILLRTLTESSEYVELEWIEMVSEDPEEPVVQAEPLD